MTAKTTLLLMIVALAASSTLHSQRSRVSPGIGFGGIWRADSSSPWSAVLRVESSHVVGRVSACASVSGSIDIFEGRVTGDMVAFKCMSLDGRRTLTFTGTITGDEIQFGWSKEGAGSAPNDKLFGEGAAPRFIARRVTNDLTAEEARLAEAVAAIREAAPVTFEQVAAADQSPENWLTYAGNIFSHRHSRLVEITATNVSRLQLRWASQAMTDEPSSGKFEATPLVVNGVMYTVLPPNDASAIDAATGKTLWTHRYNTAPTARGCCGRVNRGLAILGDTIFMGTFDAHLIALDATSGRLRWDVPIAKPEASYSITHAPLVVKSLVIVGVAGGEGGIRGFIAAFDAKTGKEVWRFNTVPGPGEFGHETWSGESWKTGGAPIWMTGSYDPIANLTYWGVGNPAPAWNGDTRLGDNLFSNSLVALDPDTGERKWHFQFTPHDEFDFDAAQAPVLVDMSWQGRPRKLVLLANKNGFFYVLDRLTGEYLLGKPFVDVNWARGLDENGRPIAVPEMAPREGGGGAMTPGNGATNWWPPSFSPMTGLLYVPAFVGRTTRHVKVAEAYVEGESFQGGGPRRPRSPDEQEGYGAIRAIDPMSGAIKWEFKLNASPTNGVLTTASNVLFTADRDGFFLALDARTGKALWRLMIGGQPIMAPMTYAVHGRQYVVVSTGAATLAFGLP